jgi:hypothetical protein
MYIIEKILLSPHVALSSSNLVTKEIIGCVGNGVSALLETAMSKTSNLSTHKSTIIIGHCASRNVEDDNNPKVHHIMYLVMKYFRRQRRTLALHGAHSGCPKISSSEIVG